VEPRSDLLYILVELARALAIFVVAFYLYCRSPLFRPLKTEWLEPKARLSLYLFFSGIAIIGSHLGVWLPGGAVANTRAVGATLAGILGGPSLGVLVGMTAGAHRISLGGYSALAGAVATTVEGLMAGLVHLHFRRRGTPERLLDWKLAFGITFLGEVVHMGIVVLLARPLSEAIHLTQVIGPPMILANSAGAALFMTVVRDRQSVYDQVAAASSAHSLGIAARTLEILAKGFDAGSARALAQVILEETGVGAVAVTDTDRVLAFVGRGSDHHGAGPIMSPLTRQAIDGNELVFKDGVRDHFTCPLSPDCPLDSVLVAPLRMEGTVLGTVQLYEPRGKRFRNMNRSLGEGLTALLSNQLLLARYQEQKSLLVVSELKLVQAQVNPHFLFNALNTIVAVLRKEPGRARELLVHLASFFRKNLKRQAELATLGEELEHVSAYLEIEKARFADRITVETEIDGSLLELKLPTFTLQPVVENAFKHGLSHMMKPGVARIRAYRQGGAALIEVEDNAGTYQDPGDQGGLGMRIVDKRIKNLMGTDFGLTVSCVPQELTRVTIRVPAPEATA
jgi:two-component system LytT family sensor kinase